MSFCFQCLDQNTTENFDKFLPRKGRAEFVKFFGGILVQTMKPKGHFEINWPLVPFKKSKTVLQIMQINQKCPKIIIPV